MLLNYDAWNTLLLSWSERHQTVMLFPLFMYPLCGVPAEMNVMDCLDRVKIWIFLFFFFCKVFVLQGYLTTCTKEKGIVSSFTSLYFSCSWSCSKVFDLPSCFSDNLLWWRLLKTNFKGSSYGRIPHCFLLLTVL